MAGKMGRPAKLTDSELSIYMELYIKNVYQNQSIIYMTTIIDREIAEEISKTSGVDVKTSQIEYFRRKNNIAACKKNWGGKREGAGRKEECVPIPVRDGTIIIDYASSGAVRLLHELDVYRLTHSCFGQGITGGNELRTSEDAKKLQEILEKLESGSDVEDKDRLELEAIKIGKRVFGEKYLNKILNPANTEESWRVEKEFEEANRFENGKLNKNGNKPNIPLAQAM